ncbi:MAG: transcriptional regulator [Rhodoglobus sp.]|nr:transcriptional regulator [Rhodoglobus sp.]
MHGSTLDVTRGDGLADLVFAAGPDIRLLISGELTPDRAITTGVVELLRGRGELLDRFAAMCTVYTRGPLPH